MPQIFRPGALSGRSARPPRTIRPKEASPTERGYGAKWRRASAAFRKRNPFCARCLEHGRMTLIVLGKTGVVDHKWPVSAGGPMWDQKNWWSLCNSHHSGWKALLEQHWRETGADGATIVRWCDDPASRPLIRGDLT